MSNNDWVQEGTPRDDEWANEEDEYGVPVEQWDDYSNEQAVPVPDPQPADVSSQTTAPDPEDVAAEAGAPVDQTDAPAETYVPEPEFSEPAAGEEAVAMQPTDVYPGVVNPADDVVDGGDDQTLFTTDENDQAAEPVGSEGAVEADADEPVGPDVYDEPVIAQDLVAEGDPVAVTSPDAADGLFDENASVVGSDESASYDDPAPHSEGSVVDDQAADAGAIPAPVLADEDGEPAVDANDARDETYAEAEAANDSYVSDEVADDQHVVDPSDDQPVVDPSVEPAPYFGDEAQPGTETVADDGLTNYDDETAIHDDEATATSDEDEALTAAVVDDQTAVVDDPDATQVRAQDPEDSVFGRPTEPAVAPVVAGGGAAAMAGLYRGETSDETQVIDTTTERRTIEQEREEEERLAQQLQAEREARAARLGVVSTSDANATRDTRTVRRGVGPFGSFGLFVLRLITAAIVGVVGYQVLTNIPATAEYLSAQSLIPEPRLVAWIIGFALAAMAVLLVIGLGVRVVGFLLAALAIATLVLLRWGQFSLFVEGAEGFRGDLDLLLAGVGILLFSLGGGRFGIDGAISKAREASREAKRS